MPASVTRTLRKLGSDLNVARRKRSMSVARMTEAAGISPGTLRRLEKGDPTVSVGALAMVMLALGEDRRLGAIMDDASDATALLLEKGALPKRISARVAGRLEL